MIRRALKLRRHIELTILKFKQDWEDENRAKRTKQVRKGVKIPQIIRDESQLTENDWDVLQRLEEILTEFETVVKTLEGDGQVRKRKHGFVGSYGNIWDVILGFERLMAKLEKFKAEAEDFPDPEQFRIGINLAWQKMDEYYHSKLPCWLDGQSLPSKNLTKRQYTTRPWHSIPHMAGHGLSSNGSRTRLGFQRRRPW